MVDLEIIRTKITQIEHHIHRLGEKRSISFQEFQKNEDIQDIVLRNLQNAIQGSLDLAGHIVADEGWTIPSTQAELFETLSDHKVITPEQAEMMKGMVGFRNIVVHEYGKINLKKVHEILTNNLKDFDRFCQQVIRYVGL